MPAKTLRAYHGDPKIKAKYLRRVRAHEKADEIIHGIYWEDGKGCAVGCTVHSIQHDAYETELGIPTWLARLEDGMFEALKNGEAKTFPRRFLSAITPGADLAPVRDQFLAWLMDDPTYGLAATARTQEIKDLAAEVGRRLRTGEGVTGPDADALTEELWAAGAARAARDARDAWEAWHAWGAREAREDAWEAWHAWGAREARGARGARAAFVLASSTELLRLLRAAR